MKSTLITFGIAILIVVVYYYGKKFYLKPGIDTGVKAEEITGLLPDGTTFSLSDLQDKYVLLDFWGSWCKPCREEHPELIKLYDTYHSANYKQGSGFEIVSFAVERNPESWKEAIRQDQLIWPYHLVSSTLFDDPVVKKYNVRQIPTRFLINSKGFIVAVDPSITQIKRILDEYKE